MAGQYSTWHDIILRAMASHDLAEAERREPVGGVDGQYMTWHDAILRDMTSHDLAERREPVGVVARERRVGVGAVQHDARACVCR